MATQEQQTALLEALTDAQIASGATAAEFAAYLGALVGAAHTAQLTPQDVGAIVSVGGIATKISAVNAQIESKRDERTDAIAEKDAEIATLETQRTALQNQLKQVVGG